MRSVWGGAVFLGLLVFPHWGPGARDALMAAVSSCRKRGFPAHPLHVGVPTLLYYTLSVNEGGPVSQWFSAGDGVEQRIELRWFLNHDPIPHLPFLWTHSNWQSLGRSTRVKFKQVNANDEVCWRWNVVGNWWSVCKACLKKNLCDTLISLLKGSLGIHYFVNHNVPIRVMTHEI